MTPRFSRQTPDGDDRLRDVCERCGFIAYDNPKIVVGSVVTAGTSILLCRRAIEPSRGLWTIPAGYMEHGETPQEGAAREAFEEATARISVGRLIAVYTIRRLGQVQLMFSAELEPGGFAPGPESEAVRLYPSDALPHDTLAFPTVHLVLATHARIRTEPDAPPEHVDL